MGTKYITELACRHLAYYDPVPSKKDVVWCRRCSKYQTITRVTVSWSLKCLHCRLGRSYGADRVRCERVAQEHASKFVGHVVVVRRGDTNVRAIDWNQDRLLPNRN